MTLVTLKSGHQVRLGRIRPKAIGETDKHLIRVSHDGTVRIIPKLSVHYNAAKDGIPPPDVVDWTAKGMAALSRMYLNDTYGDCVIAGKYHVEGVASGNEAGSPVLGTDAEVLSSYHTICGPGDNGCDITAVLDWWQSKGLPFGGTNRRIDGYVAVDWTNQLLVRVALEVFGNITLGINLPQAWTCTGCVWDVPTGPGAVIVGGHDVPAFGSKVGAGAVAGFTEDGVVIATWAGLVLITWPAFLSKTWIEEAYVCLPQDWYSKDNLAPNGIDAATLRQDLTQLGGGVIPPLPGPVPPPGPPVPVPPGPVPVPPPPAPGPVLNIVLTGDFPGIFGQTHKVTLTGTATPVAGSGPQALHIPPWLLALLKDACALSGGLPEPWKTITGVVCGLLPANAHELVAANQGATITVPPWLPGILKLLCALESNGANLPPPWNQIVSGLCGLVHPAAGAEPTATLHIPPWLLPILKLACAGTVALPPPWSIVAGIVCGLVPKGDTAAFDALGMTLSVPAWLPGLLRLLCSLDNNGASLPPPWNQIVAGLCGLVPPAAAKGPCGCQ